MSGNRDGEPTRRADHAEDSRRALLVAARQAFAEKGFADTSLEDIVVPARLTKGALYHHFRSKSAVLEALYVQMEEEIVRHVAEAVANVPEDPWTQLVTAIEAFLEASADPEYVRIVLRDAPLVLGRRRGRDLDHAIGLRFVEALLSSVIARGIFPPLPLGTASRVLLAAVSEVAVSVAYAEDPAQTRREGTEIVLTLLEGLRRTEAVSA